MAAQVETSDPLYNLRLAIKASNNPILTTSDNTPAASLAHATHISFNLDGAHRSFELTTPTRFAPDNKPVDLRSCYFAWLNKDAAVPDYLAAVQSLNEELPSGAGGSVQNLPFAQKIELIAWLNGETESSDSIAAIDAGAASVAAGDAAAIAGGKGAPVDRDGGKTGDGRLMQIYDGERRMGDHNSVLRGTKAIVSSAAAFFFLLVHTSSLVMVIKRHADTFQDFSPYRRTAQQFLRSRPSSTSKPIPSAPLTTTLTKRPAKRLEPIILLSPSASSLLRTSNIKSFLDEGVFVPADAANTASNMVRIQRVLPSISSAPITFILVDSTTSFKPTYWSRVVAIFTTGQTWQFKSYKYTNPAELFAHYPGIYVGWQGEDPPENVGNLGRGVLTAKVDKWTGSEKGRWRDREVVERIWGRIEEGMRRGGWTKDGPGLAGR